MEKPPLPTALYCRLSREDGDRMESDSIGNSGSCWRRISKIILSW